MTRETDAAVPSVPRYLAEERRASGRNAHLRRARQRFGSQSSTSASSVTRVPNPRISIPIMRNMRSESLLICPSHTDATTSSPVPKMGSALLASRLFEITQAPDCRGHHHSPGTMGGVTDSASVGVDPTTSWRNSGMVVIAPNIANPTDSKNSDLGRMSLI